MHIIGKSRFVIETHVPTGRFKNKTIDSDEGPILVPSEDPEYEWMWFAGVGLHPEMLKSGKAVPMNIWTPYPEQAAVYKDRDEADLVNKMVLGEVSGGVVSEWEVSHWREGRQVIVPIPVEVIGAPSRAGINEEGRL
jgi:hypothetical protein